MALPAFNRTTVLKFFGNTVSEAAAFGAGVAVGPVLAPAVEDLRNTAWKAHQVRAVDATQAAEIVAEDVEQDAWGRGEAAMHGISSARFDAILGAVLNAPGMGDLLQARRRNLISDADFKHGLRKAKLEGLWDAAMVGLLDVLLSPADLAMARQQGFVSETRQKSESKLQGVDDERAEILFELSGLPPGVDVAQHAANRDFIDRATFDQIVREGHTKTKYTDLLWRLRNPLLSAAVGVRLYLKGWWSAAQRDALGAEWGYTSEQMNDWYLSEGRPAAPVQMYTAWARGVDGPDGRPMDEAQFLKGIQESDIRPEWGPMLWGDRYAYPPLFQLGRLAQAGALPETRVRTILKYERYEPQDIDALADFWYRGSTGTTTDTHLSKAETQLWTAAHRSYIAQRTDDAQARVALEAAGVAPAAVDSVLTKWREERALVFAELTPTQIKKATDPPYASQADRQAALVARGYTVQDAQAFLDE